MLELIAGFTFLIFTGLLAFPSKEVSVKRIKEKVMEFKCACCDEIIQGIPTFGWDYPISYLDVPEEKREEDVFLTEDLCVIADKWFFVRGCIEIPVIGHDAPFIWGGMGIAQRR